LTWRDALPRVRIPEDSDLPLASLAAHLASAGERVAALGAYRELILASPDDLAAHEGLGAVLDRLGRADEGLAVRKRIAVLVVARMGLAPADARAALAFELALTGLGPAPAEMPAAYGAALFDAHADVFDARLRNDLRYRAPELLLAALLRALADDGGGPHPPTLDICDIGCGTGLFAPLLRPLARRLDGVDRSAGMLERAFALHLYDDLAHADLTPALAGRPAAYDVVTAADVLLYLGDLAPAFAAAATALRPGGYLAFTVEQTDEAGHPLRETGRYQHGEAYVREVAAGGGFEEVSADAVVLRVEQGQPVAGVVWVLRRRGERVAA